MIEIEPGRASKLRLRKTSEMSTILLTSGTDGEPGTLRLAAPRILTLRGAVGTRVRCTRGRGWITAEGDPADYWINPGEYLHVRAATRGVIGAVRCAGLVVTLPRAESELYASHQWSDVAADHRLIQEAIAKSPFQEHPGQSQRKWKSANSAVETALFVSVQAVMLVCIVLVAAQLFATA